MRRPQLEFIDRMVQVVFTSGSVMGVLENVGDDGSLYLRQGRTPIWVPLAQVRYVTLAEDRPPETEREDDTLT
jgi:hypothetical protein